MCQETETTGNGIPSSTLLFVLPARPCGATLDIGNVNYMYKGDNLPRAQFICQNSKHGHETDKIPTPVLYTDNGKVRTLDVGMLGLPRFMPSGSKVKRPPEAIIVNGANILKMAANRSAGWPKYRNDRLDSGAGSIKNDTSSYVPRERTAIL